MYELFSPSPGAAAPAGALALSVVRFPTPDRGRHEQAGQKLERLLADTDMYIHALRDAAHAEPNRLVRPPRAGFVSPIRSRNYILRAACVAVHAASTSAVGAPAERGGGALLSVRHCGHG